MTQPALRHLSAGVLLICIVSSNSAYTSGFRIPEASIAGLGTSNALVADTSSPGALPYNLLPWPFKTSV